MNKLKLRKPDGPVTQLMLGEAMEYAVERMGEMMDEKLEKRFGEELGPVREDIRDLKTNVNDLKLGAVEFTKDMHGLKQDVKVLKQDMHGLKQDVKVLKQDMHGLKQDVKVLKSGQVGLGRKMDGVRADLADAPSRKEFSRLEKRVDKLDGGGYAAV